MVPLNPGKQHSFIAAIPLLLAAAFIVAVHGDCGVPPRFPFAALREEYRNQTQFAVGSSVDYDCRPGYIKQYRSTLRCMKSSKWFDMGEFCKARSCLHPGEPENGRLVILTDLTFGATVQFTCEEGYRLIGDAERKCVLEGSQVTWDREIPYCQVIPCRPPPEIEHGTHTGTTMEEFNYGTSVTYQCDTVKRGQVPFSLVGEPSIHCTSRDNVNGEWSGPAPECKVIRCEQPNVDHGKQMTGYSPLYTYRASVLFECEHRYTLKGSNLLQCNENSRWAPQLPVCERSSCDDPPYISNADRMTLNSNLFPAGTVVNYKCVRGYELIPGISSASVTCQKDFTWSEHKEFCQRIKCPDPDITNGAANPKKKFYVYEDKISIQCDYHYALRNKYQLKCGSDGAWYPALPICEPDYWSVFHNSTSIAVEAEMNPQGQSTSLCRVGWNLLPTLPVQSCEPPAPINNGRDNRNNGWDHRGPEKVFLVGSRVTYTCDEGWSLVGVPSIRCIAGEGEIPHWDAPTPMCKACEPPAPINNGRANRNNGWNYRGPEKVFLVGSRVTYTCDEGWSLVGVPSIQCIAGEGESPHWDAPAPVCKVCEPPARIKNGRDNRNNGWSIWEKVFFLGSRVTYSCYQGWSLVGVRSIQCIAGEGGIPRWDAPVPECKVTPHCPNPVIENVKWISLRKNEYRMGDSVQFECESDYILQGSEKIECQANETWNPPVPSCIKVGCPKPDVQNGGMVNALDEKTWYNMNESITLKCSPGYQFSDYWYLSTTGSLNITCSANGTWSELPKCEKLIESPLCNMVRESVKFLHCGMSLTELKTRLEERKLYLEVQKLKRDLQKYNE